MKMDRWGFTLIELLVVVLIIGILSAVALPQYQKAVEKSKAAQALTLLRSTYQAAEVYFLANGTWPTSFDDLSIDLPAWTGNTKWYTYSSVRDTRSNGEWSIQLGNKESQYIFIGRISGKYAGGGFGIFYQDDVLGLPTQELLCAENHYPGGVVFEGERGRYCKSIFKGVFLPSRSSLDWFRMP